MPRFFNRPLGLIDRVLNFAGGEVPPNEMNPQPIQRVYDVAPEARLNSRTGYPLDTLGGYLYLGHTLTHAIADTQYASTDVYASFDSVSELYDFRSAEHRLWLLSIFGTVNASAVSVVQSGLEFQDPAVRTLLLFRAQSNGNALESGGASPLITSSSSVRARMPDNDQLASPLFLPPGTLWQTVSVATGAMITSMHAIFWAGPIGATPPGLR